MDFEAARQGLDLELLLDAAGAHFRANTVVPAPSPSASDLAILVTDELRACDN
jgi:hypothetical protein